MIYYMEGLGVTLSSSVVHGDNYAVLELVKADGPNKTIKLFFIKQFVDKGFLSVAHCNTDAMLAYLLTMVPTVPKI